jgi:Ca2+-binding RTX toxin-like protein
VEGSAFADHLHGSDQAEYFYGLNGNDFLDGRKGNDQLLGGQGSDNISGGEGFDLIVGGAGSDFLIGGTERDVFAFNVASETGLGWGNRDTIMDFGVNGVRDRIDLSGIDATSAPGNQAFTLVSGGFTDVAQVAVFHEGGNTYIRGNTNADLTPDFEIELIGTHQLTSFDFIL